MLLLILTSLVSCGLTSGYYLPPNNHIASHGGLVLSPGKGNNNYFRRQRPRCGPNQVLDYGKCVRAKVTRDLFYFMAPTLPSYQVQQSYKPIVPKPRIEYDVVLVSTPKNPQTQHIINPPTQKQTIVYVLSKRPNPEKPVIELPEYQPHQPEVYYINYNHGEDMELPGGMTLKEILGEEELLGDYGDEDAFSAYEHQNDLENDGKQTYGSYGQEDYSPSYGNEQFYYNR